MNKIIREENHVVFIPGNNNITASEKEFKPELEALVQELSCDLIIDMKNVETIDSSGFGLIISTHNALKENGYTLKIINVVESIYGLFCALNLENHISIET